MWEEEEPARVALRHYQDWVLPLRVVRVILTVSLFLVFVGMVLVTVGGAMDKGSLTVGGGVMAAVGGCGLLLCLLLCLHACFLFKVRDQAVQTEDSLWRDAEGTTTLHPNPGPGPPNSLTLHSALKSADSTLRRQAGGEPKKSVTYSGEVQCYSPHTTPSPSLSATSLLSSVFSSTGGTLERGRKGGDPPPRVGGGGGPQSLPPPPAAINHNHNHNHSRSLPPNVRLRQLIEDNDYDVPVERTPMLLAPPPPSSWRRAVTSQEVGRQGGSVQSAGAEVGAEVPLPRRGHVTLDSERLEKTSDYDNI